MPSRDDDSKWHFPDVERIKAIVLVETIRATPGGYKLDQENIEFLAEHFEADYLPGDPTDLAQVRRQAREILARRRKTSLANRVINVLKDIGEKLK